MPSRFAPKDDGGVKRVRKRELYSTKGDMCIIWSTIEGATSLRFPDKGSALIQALCKMFINEANNKTLQVTPFTHLLSKLSEMINCEYNIQIQYEVRLAKPFFLQLKGKCSDSDFKGWSEHNNTLAKNQKDY